MEWLDSGSRLVVAALVGGLLGAQREYDGQNAGFRTHLLVALGSALFALVSVDGFDAYRAPQNTTNVTVDVTRIAAYVPAGIGFIGGGAILKYGGRVTGITTAASLWCAAAIGVASGLGLWWPTLLTASLAMVALALLHPVSRWVAERGRHRRAALELEMGPQADLGPILDSIASVIGSAKRMRYHDSASEGAKLSVEFHHRPPQAVLDHLAQRLLGFAGVRSITLNGRFDELSDES